MRGRRRWAVQGGGELGPAVVIASNRSAPLARTVSAALTAQLRRVVPPLLGGGGGTQPPSPGPPIPTPIPQPLKRLGQIFFWAFCQSKNFFGAFGASKTQHNRAVCAPSPKFWGASQPCPSVFPSPDGPSGCGGGGFAGSCCRSNPPFAPRR